MQNWYDIAPEDAEGIDLSIRMDITAPLNEMGERCPWPWRPQQEVGLPIGQYHCVYCGAMVIAGMPHPDYRNLDEEYAEYMRQEEEREQAEADEDKSLQRRLLEELDLASSVKAFSIFIKYLKDIKQEIDALDLADEDVTGTAEDKQVASAVLSGIISSLEATDISND